MLNHPGHPEQFLLIHQLGRAAQARNHRHLFELQALERAAREAEGRTERSSRAAFARTFTKRLGALTARRTLPGEVTR